MYHLQYCSIGIKDFIFQTYVLFQINQILGQINVVRILISEITLYDTLKITPSSISCFSGQWRGNCLEYFQHFVKWYGGKPQNIQGGNIYLYILNVHVSLLILYNFLLQSQILLNDVPILWITISEMFDLQWPKQRCICQSLD